MTVIEVITEKNRRDREERRRKWREKEREGDEIQVTSGRIKKGISIITEKFRSECLPMILSVIPPLENLLN